MTTPTARTICSKNCSPSAALDPRGSPQTPCGIERKHEPALVSK
jgi:hypothetical protein